MGSCVHMLEALITRLDSNESYCKGLSGTSCFTSIRCVKAELCLVKPVRLGGWLPNSAKSIICSTDMLIAQQPLLQCSWGLDHWKGLSVTSCPTSNKCPKAELCLVELVRLGGCCKLESAQVPTHAVSVMGMVNKVALT